MHSTGQYLSNPAGIGPERGVALTLWYFLHLLCLGPEKSSGRSVRLLDSLKCPTNDYRPLLTAVSYQLCHERAVHCRRTPPPPRTPAPLQTKVPIVGKHKI